MQHISLILISLFTPFFTCTALISYAHMEQQALINNLKIKQKTNGLASSKLTATSSLKRLWIPHFSLALSTFDNETYEGFTHKRDVVERGELTYLSTFSASYNLFNGFQDHFNHKSNRAEVDLSNQQLVLQKEQLIYQLKNLYYDISHEINRLEIIKNVLKRDNELLKSASIRYRKGLIPKSDLKRREIQQLQSSDDLKIQIQAIASLKLDIEKVIGADLATNQEIEPLNYLTLERELAALIEQIKRDGVEKSSHIFFSTYQKNGTDLQILAKKIEVKEANHLKAKGNYLPTLSLSALHSYDYTNEQSDSLALNLTLSIPIFDSFDTMINTKKESLALLNAKHDYQRNSFEAQKELLKLCQDLVTSHNSFKIGQQKLESRQYIHQMMAKRFLSGTVSTKNLIDEEILLQEEKFALAGSSYKIRKIYLTLNRMVGQLRKSASEENL